MGHRYGLTMDAGPIHRNGEQTMCDYIGLNVSLKETAISVRRNGRRVWRSKYPSDPGAIAAILRRLAPNAKRVVFETSPLSVWFCHALSTEGIPTICVDVRHAKTVLDMAPNEIDTNDADGLAQLAEIGFDREVRVKGGTPPISPLVARYPALFQYFYATLRGCRRAVLPAAGAAAPVYAVLRRGLMRCARTRL
ncbi:hypothetical protein SAMN04244581_00733 [Paracoccus denitrificans]|uniref:Uncharacterized protein n=1 Tax=Paracoccus denitrificans (strain Pd 1222) TaxID=318586 RepID=A1B3G9_PARDP|nr:hypothetical protein Pden_1971 [Paracoccus denitrificans PD1222]SDI12770.1 hypothetical protein SAMN04244581_00733 [Paracoccus denitrificans]SFR00000.1 hypothetical protein SAMN04244569_00971 [Paracoccus denitrificans]